MGAIWPRGLLCPVYECKKCGEAQSYLLDNEECPYCGSKDFWKTYNTPPRWQWKMNINTIKECCIMCVCVAPFLLMVFLIFCFDTNYAGETMPLLAKLVTGALTAGATTAAILLYRYWRKEMDAYEKEERELDEKRKARRN